VHGISLSREQVAYAQTRLAAAGLAERTRIELRDYRDLDRRYDRIASIEMFEAVGEAYWPRYAATLARSLKSGGAAGLQIITIDERRFDSYRCRPDFIQRHVFPGGMLPTEAALERVFAAAGLAVTRTVRFGLDYARTLLLWRERFEAAWPGIAALGFDERFRRLWRYYLCYCEAGFRLGAIDVVQVRVEHAAGA
jgi:cyclopropane-fatty-acyl-phospholipid synthase